MEIIKMLEQNGWQFDYARGSHHYFIHSAKSGKVTVPHPKKELAPGTARSILKQAGLL